MHDVEGKVTVISGAAGGSGLGPARAFAGAGMRLVLTDIDQARLRTSVEGLDNQVACAYGVPTDVTDRASIQALRDGALRIWIFTHPEWIDGALKRRCEAMLDNGALAEL